MVGNGKKRRRCTLVDEVFFHKLLYDLLSYLNEYQMVNSPLIFDEIKDTIYLRLLHCANPFPVMITGISLCTHSHREFPVMNTGSLK